VPLRRGIVATTIGGGRSKW